MADNIIKLRIESGEYEQKLKRAADGLQRFGEEAHQVGKAIDLADKEQANYIRMIGQMETVNRSARGKINELSNAFVELSSQYRHLTDEEKNSPFGEALSSSIEQLKQRVQDGKKELEDINRELNATSNEGQETGGVMKQLADRFTVNIDAMKLFDIGLKAINGALSVAKDAFGASEANVDEWGRIVQSAHSVYDGFLNALNTGDISGFLGRIDEIIIAARNAYDELDRLSTMQTIQRPEISRQQTENDRLRQMIMTRRYIPKAQGFDWFGAGMKGGQLLDDNQVRMLEVMLQNGMNKIVDLTKNEVKQSGRAIDAFYESFAKDIGMTVDEFRRGTSSMEEFDKRVKGAQAYNEWQYQNSFIDQQTGRMVAPRGGNPYAQYKGWDVFRVDGERYNNLVNLILQRDQQVGQMYSMQSQAYRTMNRAEGITSRIGGGGGGGGRGSGSVTQQIKVEATESLTELQLLEDQLKTVENSMSGYGKGTDDWKAMNEEAERLRELIKELNGETKTFIEGFSIQNTQGLSAYISMIKQQLDQSDFGSALYDSLSQSLVDTTTLQTLVEQSLKAGLGTALFDVADDTGADFWTRAMEGGVDNVDWQSIVDKINEKLQSIGYEPIKIDFETGNIAKAGKQTENSWKAAANAVQSVGSALQQIDDPGAKIVGLIGQAIANIALGFAQATAASSGAGIFGWIAAIAGGLATMTSTIAAIHSATGYAEGGIVKGTTFSGDQIPADSFVNAGELILNRSQQNSIASQLQEASRGGGNGIARVSGEQIYIATNAYLRRSGKGELVTWK